MEVGTGTPPRGTHGAQDGALSEAVPFRHEALLKVGVKGRRPIGVFHLYGLTVPLTVTCGEDPPGGGGADQGARRGGDVHPLVEALLSVEGIVPRPVGGGEPSGDGKDQRGLRTGADALRLDALFDTAFQRGRGRGGGESRALGLRYFTGLPQLLLELFQKHLLKTDSSGFHDRPGEVGSLHLLVEVGVETEEFVFGAEDLLGTAGALEKGLQKHLLKLRGGFLQLLFLGESSFRPSLGAEALSFEEEEGIHYGR